MNKDKIYNLKQSELNVLNVLWSENEPLMASEIAKRGNLINSTVQVALRDLRENNIVNVNDIVVNVTALSRKYFPSLTKEEYENLVMTKDFKNIINKSISNPSFVMALLDQNDIPSANAEIEALQNLVNEYREEIKKKEII